ncbi:MAG: MvdD family ATP-grasp ribosomal peptide maturase [Cyanobacteria bacterium P01_B01_bin.77]
MTVLIITHSNDNGSILKVMSAIHDQGGKTFRFNTDQFPTALKLELSCNNRVKGGILTTDQGTLDLSTVSSVWYRRFRIGQNLPSKMEPQLRNASIQEARRTIQGMLASLDVFHLDPVVNIRRAEHKQLQLQVAHEVGLEIPDTLITNDPATVRKFSQTYEQGVISKMMTSFAVHEDGKEKVVFTNPLSSQDLEELEGLQFCPMTFQENIPKALELRVTVVGKTVFAAAIDSQRLEKSRADWRREGVTLLNDWTPYALPMEIKEKLLALMERLHLNYGAIDIILTPDNKYVFLEVNPCGEFFWLDLLPKLSISQAIAQLLYAPPNKPHQSLSNHLVDALV